MVVVVVIIIKSTLEQIRIHTWPARPAAAARLSQEACCCLVLGSD
ncbi:hypothetical protein LINGRAHAP2_LOCUS31402 [Linum grandiflorum]